MTTSAAGITQAPGGVIDPGALAIISAGPVSLGNANTVDTLAASITGTDASLLFNNTGNPLTVGSVRGVTGITTSNGNVTLSVVGSGGLTVSQAINAGTGSVTGASVGDLALGSSGTVTGGAITLATNGNFTNNAGASALSAGSGNRWLVYSTNPANDNDGGLAPAFIQYAANYDVSTLTGTKPAAAGNGLLYSAAPQITLNSVTKTYDGTTAIPTSASAYALSAAINGDTLSLDVSGASGAYQSANVGTSIPVSLDGLALSATHGGIPVFGYSLANAGGGNIGIINAAALTVTASNQAKTYGQTVALGTTAFTTGTLFNGDTVTGVTLASSGAPGSATVAGSPYAITASNAVGNGLSNYTINYVGGLLTVNPAGLTITASDQAKTYGQTVALGTTAFTTGTLFNGDTVTGVTLASSGAPGSATVAGSPYAITASNAVGNGLSNYTISYANGLLTVNPAALTVTASNQAKTYGQTVALGTTAFTTGTLFNGDTVTGVTLASSGAPGSATVAGSPYAITASNAVGSGLSNYTISYANGLLTVNPAALTVTASNQAKTYGQTVALGTTAFTTGTLFNGDTVTGVTLASSGAPGSATVAGSPYAITASNAVGNGLSNYTINYVGGLLTVNPAGLTITASNQAKTYGQTVALGTTAFTTGTLFNGDTVTGVTLASSGAPGSATVAGSPYAITASNAVGNGLSNYTINYVGGLLTVNPAGLTITASDQAKTYGQTVALGTTAFTTGTLFNGDTVTGVTLASSGAPGSATVAGSPYAITASNAVGNGLSNYTISYVGGLLTVNPARLNVALTGTVSKVFDGTTLATLVPANYVLDGVIGSDAVGLNNPTSGTYASANPGTGIGVNVVGLALMGPAAGNYVLLNPTANANIGVITAPPTPPNRPDFTGEIPPLTQPLPVAQQEMPIIQPSLYQPGGPLYVIGSGN